MYKIYCLGCIHQFITVIFLLKLNSYFFPKRLDSLSPFDYVFLHFILDENDNQTAFESEVKSGQFAIHVRFPKEGDFKLGVLPGESGSSVIKNIKVLKNTCIEEAEDVNLAPVSYLELNIEKGDTVIRWTAGNYNLFKLTFAAPMNISKKIVKSIFAEYLSYIIVISRNSNGLKKSSKDSNLAKTGLTISRII